MSDAERIERTIAQLEQSLEKDGWSAAEIRDIENVITGLKSQLENLK